jgi:hypothetical protein
MARVETAVIAFFVCLGGSARASDESPPDGLLEFLGGMIEHDGSFLDPLSLEAVDDATLDVERQPQASGTAAAAAAEDGRQEGRAND